MVPGVSSVHVIVEIPRGSRNKYEASEDGLIWFDRRLGGPAGFPGDYGYVIVPEADHHADHLQDLGDLPAAFLEELDAFFTAYRMLESAGVEVLERQGHDAAVAVLVGT